MAGMSVYVSAVLHERVSFEAVVQEQSHDEGWFASIRIEDGKRGGTNMSLIARDPAVLAKLAEAALSARDELTALMAVDDSVEPDLPNGVGENLTPFMARRVRQVSDFAEASAGQPAGPPF